MSGDYLLALQHTVRHADRTVDGLVARECTGPRRDHEGEYVDGSDRPV
ncbi:hypothetical protein [Streptomyces sp. NPDC055189]